MTKTKPFEVCIHQWYADYRRMDGTRGGWMDATPRRRSFATQEAAERAAGAVAVGLAQEGKTDGWRAVVCDSSNSGRLPGPVVSVVEPKDGV